jgi:hypothetical protein
MTALGVSMDCMHSPNVESNSQASHPHRVHLVDDAFSERSSYDELLQSLTECVKESLAKGTELLTHCLP